VINALGPGLGLPSGNPQQGRSMGTPSQTRDISPIQRREAVATHRILRDRVPFVRGLINALTDLALGDQGMIPTFASGDSEYDKRALAYYKRATRRQTWDITGQDNGASMQRLVLRTMITDGEIFGIKVIDSFGNTQRQLVVTEQIGSMWNSTSAIVDGIEYNSVHRPITYHVQQISERMGAEKSRPIAARDIMHVYDRERATQKRGLPWGYTGLDNGINTIDINQLVMGTMKMNASVIGSMTTPTGEVPKAMEALLNAATAASAAGTAASTPDSQRDTTQATRFLDVYGSMIPIFKAGEGMTFMQGRTAANEIDFLGWLLAQYATGLGLPADIVVGIATGSAATHANSDIVQRFLKCVQRLIVDDWNQPSTENLLSNGIFAWYFPERFPGVLPLQPPNDPSRYADIQWRGPRGYQVNKTRDAKSNVELISRGLKTIEEYWSESGEDPLEAEEMVDKALERRRQRWLDRGWPEDRFWQREFGPNAQMPPAEQNNQN
jgi:hypothetical protein